MEKMPSLSSNDWFSFFKRTLLANSFWVSLRYSLVAIIGLGVSVAFARLSTKEVYGQYQFVLSLLALLSIFSLPGLNIAALKSIAQGKFGAVTQAVKWSFLGSVCAIPFLVGYGLYILQSGVQPTAVGWACISLGVLYPLLYAPNTWYAYYEGKLLFYPVAVRSILVSLVTAVSVFTGLWFGLDVFWLLLAWGISTIVCTWIFFGEVFRHEKRGERGIEVLDMRYGLRVSFQKFIVGFTENFPAIAISAIIGFEAVASYQVASVFVGAVSGLLGALSAIALPVIFSEQKSSSKPLLLYSVISGIIASIGYWIFVQFFFRTLYGEGYQESFRIAQLFSLLPLFVSLRMFFVNMLTAKEENAFIVLAYLVANTIAIAVFILLMKTTPFSLSVASYLYVLNISLLLCFFFRSFSGYIRE